MFVVGKDICFMVRGIIIAKERISVRILAVIPILGLHHPWLGPDKFHEEESDATGESNLALYKPDMGCPFFLGERHLFDLGTRGQRLFHVQKVFFDQQTLASLRSARALVSSWYVSHSPAHSMILSSSPYFPV